MRAIPAIAGHVRTRLARQISDSHIGPAGYIPLVTLSPEWEAAFNESLVGPPEDRQLAIAPTPAERVHAAVPDRVRLRHGRRRGASAAVLGEHPRPCARDRRAAARRLPPCLAQTEVYSRARIRTLGTCNRVISEPARMRGRRSTKRPIAGRQWRWCGPNSVPTRLILANRVSRRRRRGHGGSRNARLSCTARSPICAPAALASGTGSRRRCAERLRAAI